jgi:hypothetical protein
LVTRKTTTANDVLVMCRLDVKGSIIRFYYLSVIMENTKWLGLIPILIGIVCLLVAKFMPDDFFKSRWVSLGTSTRLSWIILGVIAIIFGVVIILELV